MKKQFVCSVALLALLIIPTSSHAATPDIQTLTQQLQTLSAKFEELKLRAGDKASSTPKVKNASSTVDRTCMATAVVTRENSVATAWTTFGTKMTDVLTERKSALVDAWNMTDAKERHKAITAAWKTSRASSKSVNEQLKSSRKAAWETFQTTAKSSCKVELPKEESLEKSAKDSIAL